MFFLEHGPCWHHIDNEHRLLACGVHAIQQLLQDELGCFHPALLRLIGDDGGCYTTNPRVKISDIPTNEIKGKPKYDLYYC